MKRIIWIFLLIQLSCTQNILQDMSSSNPDEDFYSQAMSALNNESYDEAIGIVTQHISPAGQTTVRTRELLASAYAGKCGLNFVEYTQKLAENTTGSAMMNLMMPFVQVEVDPSYCRLALQTMELIGPTEARTVNQNIFTSITGMVLLGTALRAYADQAPVLGDGTADVNLCTAVTDVQIDDMIIGFGFFNKNFASISESMIGSYSNDSLGDASSACNTTAGAANCMITDPTSITAPIRDAFRDLANTADYGIGTFPTGGDPLMIPLSCP